MAELGVFVPVSAPFPGTDPDNATFWRLLRTLSRTDVVFWCARLNHILTNPSDLTQAQRQLFGVREFFCADEILRIQAFAGGRDRRRPEPTVFFRGQLLELLRWALLICEDHPKDGTTFEDPEVRRTFAKVALIASEMWSNRIYGDALNLDGGVNTARQRSVGPLRKGVEGGLVAPELSQSLGRGWQLFHRLMPSLNPSFSTDFHLATGLTIEDYYVCCAALIAQFMKPGSQATIFDASTIGSTTRDHTLVQRFIALESQTVDELRNALWHAATLNEIPDERLRFYDYKALRARPLIRAADGRTIIVDPIFMAKKTAVGPLFHVLALTGQDANALFADFGSAFERYIQDILRRCFPRPSAALFDPLTCDLRRTKAGVELFQIDACVNYITDLVLVEIKGTWPREAEFVPSHSETLLQSLRRQYGFSERGKEGGVGQLARAITAIASRDWPGPANQFQFAKNVIPVLVVHDTLLTAPGFGGFIAAEFERAIQRACEKLGCGQGPRELVPVVPPIVATAEDLEVLETSLEHIGLREVLTDYSEADPDRLTSLRDFLASSPKYSPQIRANRFLASVALDILERTEDRLFPKSSD